ncbi:type II toxin-antitoxin system HicB family antitoxin [Anaerovibrio sp.]|uniref:type II toxin-antitoxin system HicB family antitoxin n=1 Tax=Anaerovibrio sp. TaxID=1872532 RepID=UPI0038909B38
MYKNLPNNYIYPAIIEHCDGNYCLYFPDLPGCVASSDTVEKTVEMGKRAAKEYLWELENDGSEIPAASPTTALELNQGDAICIVDINMFSIRAKMDNRTVKKTLTIPWHLNELAEAKHINFSSTLRQALQEKLGI